MDILYQIGYTGGWFMALPVLEIVLIRYLVFQNIPSLFGALFMMKITPIILGIVVFIQQNQYFIIQVASMVGNYKHPMMNSPNYMGNPFNFSLSLIFISSLLTFFSMVLTVKSLEYSQMNAVKFLALFYCFETLFRSVWSYYFLKRHMKPQLTVLSLILLALVYFIEDWFYVTEPSEKQRFSHRLINFGKSNDWEPLLYIIFSALISSWSSVFWKYNQFTQIVTLKQHNDLISWANYLQDEPSKINTQLCVHNKILSHFFELQKNQSYNLIRQFKMYHTESRFKDIKIEELDELQARYLVDNYFKSERIYSYHDLEQFHQQLRDDKDYKLLFDQEAVDDPEILDEGCQISYKKVIRNHIFKLQLQSQKYSELFSADRYQNFLFERLFDEFSLDNEFIWKDKPTTFLMNTVKMFFEGIFLLLAAFYNQEFENEDIWSKGFELKERLGYEMSSVSYYLLLWLFLGSFTFVRPMLNF